MRKLKAVLPLMLFSVAATGLSACETTKRAAVSLRPDLEHPERFICEPAGTRPVVPAEYVIDWAAVTTVAQARAEHEKFVGVLRTREGVVAGYVLDLEGKHFICFSNMTWQRDFYRGLPAPAGPPPRGSGPGGMAGPVVPSNANDGG